MTQHISINNEFINWKAFLLLLSNPFPVPAHFDLHQSLAAFKSHDQANIGMVTKEDYVKVFSFEF